MKLSLFKIAFAVWVFCIVVFSLLTFGLSCSKPHTQTGGLEEYANSMVNLDWTIEAYALAVNSPVVEEEVNTWVCPMLWSEYKYVERVVMAESGNQTIEGQMAVAQCIRNTAEVTGKTAYQVVTTPGQYATPQPETVATDSVKEACYRVFHDGEDAVSATIQWFYNPSRGYSKWHESKNYVTTIGAHKFFA